MKICMVEIEPSEREFFEQKIRRHELHFCPTLAELEVEPDILSTFIYSPIDARVLDAHPGIRMISTRSTTFDHIDLEACKERHITVCNVCSYGDNTVAEHTFALILALARRLREIIGHGKEAHFSYESVRGVELKSKTLGIFGAGRIGRQVIPLAKAFGMEVLACDSKPDESVAGQLGFHYASFDELLRRSHIISIHAPLMSATFHVFNREAFAVCRRGLLLVNTARGAIIDTDALLDAMDKGIVAGVGLDVLEDERPMRQEAAHIISDEIIKRMQSVFSQQECRTQDSARIKELQTLMCNSRLLSRDNVIFTPHVAFNSMEAVARINQMTVDNIVAFITGAPIHVVSKN